MRECRGLKTVLNGESSKKPWRDNDETENGQGGERGKNKGPTYQDPTKAVATIFGGRAVSKDKQEQKLVSRHVMSVATYDGPVADPKYLNWSEHPITFSRADQWSDIPYP
jgi:hypothetical protein